MLKIFFSIYVILTIMIHLNFEENTRYAFAPVYTITHHNKEVEIEKMKVFSVELPIQIGSGSRWVMDDKYPSDIKILSQEMKDIKPLPGGRQLQIFHMMALRPGIYNLNMQLKHPSLQEADSLYQLKLQVSF